MLLNGCSYGAAWSEFPGINLSQNGGSFYRSVRTTVEYCATHGNPSAVLIPISFIDRQEFVCSGDRLEDREVEGPYNKSNSTNELYELNQALIMLKGVNYPIYDLFFLTLSMFCAWLDQQNIPYLIWDQCNNFKRSLISEYKAIKKLKYLEENKRIVPLFNFCANDYIHKNGGQLNDSETSDPVITHYTSEEYSTILGPFLNRYAAQHDLGIEGLDKIIVREQHDLPEKHNWLDYLREDP